MESSRLDPHVLQKALQEREFSPCVIITFQVMAVSRVSPRDPHTVSPVSKGSQYELGAHPGRAGDPDNPEIGGILKPAYTRQVSRPIAAPIAQKGGNLSFPIAHRFLLIAECGGRNAPGSKDMPPASTTHPGHAPLTHPSCIDISLHQRLNHISLIMAMIWSSPNPLRFSAPDRQEATHNPHPLHKTGLTWALPANRPSVTNDGAE